MTSDISVTKLSLLHLPNLHVSHVVV